MSQDKVEMSVVPPSEKKATEEPAKTEEAGEKPAEGEKPKAASKFRQFFSRDRSRSGERKDKTVPEATDGKEAEPPAEKKEAAPVVKTPYRWFPYRKSKEGKENGAETKTEECPMMTIGINMLDRDEKGIIDHIKLQFEDVFAEPDGYHSMDCAWRLTYRVFTGTRCVLYKLLSLICALPCAVVWGITFALLSVCNIWACVPFGRALTIPAIWIAKMWNFVVRSLFDPLFRSCGLCLGGITLRRFDQPTDPAHVA